MAPATGTGAPLFRGMSVQAYSALADMVTEHCAEWT